MINNFILKLFLLTILVSLNYKSYSQDSIFNILSDQEYKNLILPPIDTLFYYAEKNPTLDIYIPRILEQEANIKTEKRIWLNYFRISTSYQYGYIGAQSLTQGYTIPSFYQTSQNAQSLYHVGVILSIPLDDVINRKNNIKKHEHKLEEIKHERSISVNIQKLTIVELYNKANEFISVLNIRTEAKNFAEVLFVVAQKDFINGKIDVSTLSQIKHSESVAFSELEYAKNELKTALMKLEVICNYKFQIIKNL